MINITEKQEGELIILELSGRLDSNTYLQAEAVFTKYFQHQDLHHMLVDCSSLGFLSSSGIRIFLMAMKKYKAKGGRFVLCGLSEDIHELFEFSGLLPFLEIWDDQHTALNKLRTAK